LSSHSDVREPVISVIVKIRALGESFFKQMHNQVLVNGLIFYFVHHR